VLVNTMKGVMKERGILGFYQGLSASLLRQGTYSTIRFATYDFIKEKMESHNRGGMSLSDH
jgi:solute carrier family 25 (mitochondrial dicarboxylate transporter), member 10